MNKLLITLLALSTLLFTSQSCKKDSKVRVEKNHRKSTGASARALLSSDDYKKMVVQIQYMSGFRPADATLARLTEMMEQRLNKPDGIRIVFSEIGAQGKASYSIDDVKKLEDGNRSEFTTRKEIAVYFLFLDGDFSGNNGSSKVLGAAYYNTSMVIFEKTVRDVSGGFGGPPVDKVESSVVNHELGHILGLVNLGTTMQSFHQDTDHGAHCNNEDCLMNWLADTGDAINNLLGNSPVPVLDQNCIKDLQANGGK